MRTLIVGCGYIGLSLGAALRGAGHDVFGLRRSPELQPALREAGIHPLVGDITEPAGLSTIPGPFDWVILCASAGHGGPEAYERVYVQGTQNLLIQLGGQIRARFVYTSSTSVYGQNDGSWVTEASVTKPGAATGQVLLKAEQLVLDAARESGVPGIVLRLAGIYGPGRDYWRRLFLEGQARLDGDGSRFLNMIHREDVAGAIGAALEHGENGGIYNVVDNEPVSQRALFDWLAERLATPRPVAGPSEDSARKRGITNKRVSNQKLRERLGYALKYPTFRQGFETL